MVLSYTTTNCNDASVLLSFTPNGAGSGNLVLAAQGYGNGQNFDPAPGQQQDAKTATVTAVQPFIQATSNGTILSTTSCAMITGSSPPAMPQLTATLFNVPATMTVSWSLVITDSRPDLPVNDGIVFTYPALLGPLTLSAINQLSPTDSFIGGTATIEAVYGPAASVSATFCISGQNPSSASVTAFMNSNQNNEWPVLNMFTQESALLQFNYGFNSKSPRGYPLTDGPCINNLCWGWGVTQLSNGSATADQMYNWQSNVTAGMALIGTLTLNSDIFYAAAVNNSISYGASHLYSILTPGVDSAEGLCTFNHIWGRTASGSPHSYSDAIMMKRYNSAATNHDFIGWNVGLTPAPQVGISPTGSAWTPVGTFPDWTAPGPPQTSAWYVQRLAQNDTDYVGGVCSHGN